MRKRIYPETRNRIVSTGLVVRRLASGEMTGSGEEASVTDWSETLTTEANP